MKLKYSKVPQSTPNIPQITPSILKCTPNKLKSIFNVLKSGQKWPNMVNFYIFQPEIENTLHVGNTYIDSIVEYIKNALGLLGKYWGMKEILNYSQFTQQWPKLYTQKYSQQTQMYSHYTQKWPKMVIFYIFQTEINGIQIFFL